ncbi:hypothetical protein BpHYR1_036597 [Brachionus plicatilis]|uniref:Uncharacterized protein n=1 Tax=Brachionus plicatilis TaxID=10195 RepID=A0A3M7T392_BRAPC|nr:hypothetical protein BpHYR1_036597 [Brachionus plicatilis]
MTVNNTKVPLNKSQGTDNALSQMLMNTNDYFGYFFTAIAISRLLIISPKPSITNRNRHHFIMQFKFILHHNQNLLYSSHLKISLNFIQKIYEITAYSSKSVKSVSAEKT